MTFSREQIVIMMSVVKVTHAFSVMMKMHETHNYLFRLEVLEAITQNFFFTFPKILF